MMLSWKPKPGSVVGKPGFVQQMGEPGPPDFNMEEHIGSGLNMAASRLISGVQSNDAAMVLSSLRNILALMENEPKPDED